MNRKNDGSAGVLSRIRFFVILLSFVFFLSPTLAQVSSPDLDSTDQKATREKEYDLHLTKGVVFFNANRYQEAKEQFILALSSKPNDPEATYYKGITEARLNQSSEATADLWSISATGGVQQDDNVLLEPENATGTISQKADQRLIFVLQANYHLLNRRAWDLRTGYFFYQSLHNDLDEFNAQIHQGTLNLAFKKQKLDYTIDTTSIDRQRYLFSHALRGTTYFIDTNKIQGSAFYQLQQKDFIDSDLFRINSNRDGLTHALGAEMVIGEGKRLWQAGYTIDFEDLRTEDWSSLGHRFHAGRYEPLWRRFSYNINFVYTIRRYQAVGTFWPRAPREDNQLKANLALTTLLFSKGEVFLGYSFTDNRSNTSLFDYRRGIASLNFTGRF